MAKYFEAISFLVIIFNLVTAHDPYVQKTAANIRCDGYNLTTRISPELVNELKDFENLISKTTLDEIIAEHYVLDGSFRRALTYLRSQEFNQLQKQLLNVPEIVDVLTFLHLIVKNATTMHMGAVDVPTTTAATGGGRVNECNDGAATDLGKSIDKITTYNGSVVTKPQQTVAIDKAKEEAVKNLSVPKRPLKQFYIKEKNSQNVGFDGHPHVAADDDDDESANPNSIASSEQQPLMEIVLLGDLEVTAKVHNKEQHHRHHHKYNNYHLGSVGTFTSFVEEVLGKLPVSDYQKMITDKCQKNPNFAKFYKSLRSPILKPYIDGLKTKPNIQKIIATLNSHDVDANALQPIAFKVISWGPNV